MIAVGVVRWSTNKQNGQRQRWWIRRVCEEKGYRLVGTFEQGLRTSTSPYCLTMKWVCV